MSGLPFCVRRGEPPRMPCAGCCHGSAVRHCRCETAPLCAIVSWNTLRLSRQARDKHNGKIRTKREKEPFRATAVSRRRRWRHWRLRLAWAAGSPVRCRHGRWQRCAFRSLARPLGHLVIDGLCSLGVLLERLDFCVVVMLRHGGLMISFIDIH